MSPFGDPCGLSSHTYSEKYSNAELSLKLLGTGTTRSLYILTARADGARRLLFDMRIEAGLDELLARAQRADRYPDAELKAVALSYARYLVDTGAFGHSPHFRLQIGEEAEVLEPLGR